MESYHRIRDFLSTLRRRLDATSAGEAALAGLSALVVGAVGALAVAAAGGGRAGWWVAGLGLALAMAAAWRLWLTPRRGRRRDEALARWVEGRVAGLHSGVITAVETERLLGPDGPARDRLGFSPALAHAAADRTARRLEAVATSDLVDRRRLKRLGLDALAVLLVAGLVFALAPSLLSEGARALVAPPPAVAAVGPGESLVDVALGDLAFKLVYPAYTGLQPRTLERSTGDIKALSGTEVRFTGVTLSPATEAILVLESEPGARWPLTLSADGTVTGALRVAESDRYQFILTEADGTVVRERQWRAVDAITDAAPEVRLLLPESDLEVHEGDQVPLLFEAADDYGIDEVRLIIEGPRDKREERVLRRAQGERRARAADALAVGPLNLEPGDAVQVWFEASDLNTITGPGVGRSVKRRVTMYSPDKEHDELLGQLERLIDGLIEVLAERLESPVQERRTQQAYDYVQHQQDISAATATVLKDFEQLIVAARTDPLATDAFKAGLQAAFERIEGVHEQEAIQLRRALAPDSVSPRPSVLVSLLAASNDEGVEALEAAIFDLQRLLDEARQDTVLDKGRELLETQNDLLELLKQLKDGGSDALKAEAAKKLQQLAEKLQKMQQEMSKLAERVPYENQNASHKPSDAQRDMVDMASAIDQVKQLIAEGKIDEAMKLLEDLNKQTQELMAGLQNDFTGGPKMTASAQKAAQELHVKLGQVADAQRGVRDETGEVEQRQAAREREALKDALQGARDKARELERKLGAVPRQGLHADEDKRLEGLQRSAGELAQQLGEGEFEGAHGKAKRLEQGADALAGEVAQSQERELDLGRAGQQSVARSDLEDSSKQANALAAELERLSQGRGQGGQGPAPPAMGEADKGELQRLGKRQGQLQKQVGELDGDLGELDKEVPGIKQRLQDKLDRAGDKMSEAKRELGHGAPRSARQAQDEALEQLKQAASEMEEQLKPRDDRRSNDGVGINDPTRKVAIPEGDDYRIPKQFREQLLKAMKERAPERFHKRIERYYQDLIK